MNHVHECSCVSTGSFRLLLVADADVRRKEDIHVSLGRFNSLRESSHSLVRISEAIFP